MRTVLSPEWKDLTEPERDAVRAWLGDISPSDVPINGVNFDAVASEWVISVALRNDRGRTYLDPSGELAVAYHRRPAEPPLPWPSRRTPDERAKTVEQFRAALLDGLEQIERHGNGGGCVGAGDVADLVARVALEVAG